jgi:hypothetical protein
MKMISGAIGGMKIGRGNRSTRRKPAPAPLCPPQNPTWPDPGRGGKPATNRLSYGAALLHQSAFHSQKVTVWCGLSSFYILGAYFSEGNNGHAVTVTAKRYVAMFNKFLLPELHRRYNDILLVWFNKMAARHLTRHESPCKQFEKRSQDVSSREMVMSLGLHARQIYPNVTTSYGDI